MILGLDHVQLAMPVGGEDKARGFYGALLGLREVPKPPGLASRGGCWFKGADTYVHLGAQEEFAPARKAHPAFLVADLEALRQRFERAGIVTIPDDAVPYVRRFYTVDPFGNRLEFIQYGNGFSQRKRD
jgi:catechol 2,3-dioxygenase-like lactoylglutathione lyase family enzyme